MKTLIGSCTQYDKTRFEETCLYKSLLRELSSDSNHNYLYYEGSIDAVIKLNNRENIALHYNKMVDLAITDKYDCLILMHDDVSIEDRFLAEKLGKAFEDYDVVGLAGAKKVEIKKPALWHLMSLQKDWSGSVAHPYNDKQLLTTTFGPTPERCLVLDGLFMAIKVSSIVDEVRFDEKLPAVAHHYDIDFCLQANKHKLKLTTWPIWVVHRSSGLEEQSPDFLDSEKYFLNKWKPQN